MNWDREGGTVHSFSLHLEAPLVLGYEVVEFLIRVFDGTDLVLFIDTIPSGSVSEVMSFISAHKP